MHLKDIIADLEKKYIGLFVAIKKTKNSAVFITVKHEIKQYFKQNKVSWLKRFQIKIYLKKVYGF